MSDVINYPDGAVGVITSTQDPGSGNVAIPKSGEKKPERERLTTSNTGRGANHWEAWKPSECGWTFQKGVTCLLGRLSTRHLWWLESCNVAWILSLIGWYQTQLEFVGFWIPVEKDFWRSALDHKWVHLVTTIEVTHVCRRPVVCNIGCSFSIWEESESSPTCHYNVCLENRWKMETFCIWSQLLALWPVQMIQSWRRVQTGVMFISIRSFLC